MSLCRVKMNANSNVTQRRALGVLGAIPGLAIVGGHKELIVELKGCSLATVQNNLGSLAEIVPL